MATQTLTNFNSTIKHFSVEGELKDIMDSMDRANIRTTFKQASDPIHLAFKYIDNKPLSYLVKEFASDTASDFIEFVSGIFSK